MSEPGPMEFLITGIAGDDQRHQEASYSPTSRAKGDGALPDRQVLECGRVRMVYRAPTRRLAVQVWSEGPANSQPTACVYVLGWCYRIGSGADALEPDDHRRFVERHRQGLPPVDDDFSGNYVVVIYDAESGRVSVQPDRWAMSTVFFWESDQGIAVSNRAVAVADNAGAAIDGYSFLSLIRGTHMPFGRSLFLGVHRVLCGQYLSIDIQTGRLEVRRAAPSYLEIVPRSRGAAVDLVEGTVRDLARRLVRAPEPSVFDLTGGNDTRLLAAGVSAETPRGLSPAFGWNVVGDESHPDVKIARRVAQLCNWQIRRLDSSQPRDASRSELENAVIQGDGSCPADVAFCRMDQELTARGNWEWLAGAVGGELLRGFWWGQEALSLGVTSRVNYGALFDYRIRPSSAALTNDSMSPWPSIQRHNEVLMEPYHEIGRAGGERLNTYKLDTILQYRLSYSAGNSHSWLAGVRSIRLPFLSWEFTRVALSLPWRLRRNRDLSLHVIRRLNPSLSDLPNDTGAPMTPLGLSSAPAYARMGIATTFHKAGLGDSASAREARWTQGGQSEAAARLVARMSHGFGRSALPVRPGRCPELA